MVAECETACESSDWQWAKFKYESNIANWSPELLGNKRIGVALIGLGRMGLIHLRNLLREPRAQLLYCIDSNHGRLAKCSKSMFFREFNIRALHPDQFDSVALADPAVRVVMIATPTSSHEDLTRRALAAGKNVLCEKPLTNGHIDSIMPLYELARAHGVFLLAAFQRRYDPDFRHVADQVRSGALGPLQLIKSTSRDSQRPPLSYVCASGGLFHDTCIHDIDLCLWLARQLPISLQVSGQTWQEACSGPNGAHLVALLNEEERGLVGQVEDYFLAIITMKFSDGSLATIDNGRQASYGYDQRLELHGTRAMLRCDGKRSLDSMVANERGIAHANWNFNFASRYGAAYANELQDLLTMAELADNNLSEERELCRDNLMEPVRPSLVVAAHTIADACREAARSGRTISLTWTDAFQRQFKQEIEL